MTQSFSLQVPTNFPQPDQPTTSFARFRISSVRALSPTGIAPDGEVEDYAIVIHPGLPATAVNDQYSMIEDLPGTLTVPALSGVTANDTPSGVGLSALLVTPPAVGTLTGINTTTLNNGSFTYTAPVDFFGDVTFTYRSFNGILG
ncbi:MAG: Ig-like domain-containing protein, partial [Pirellulaceae bacterium]